MCLSTQKPRDPRALQTERLLAVQIRAHREVITRQQVVGVQRHVKRLLSGDLLDPGAFLRRILSRTLCGRAASGSTLRRPTLI